MRSSYVGRYHRVRQFMPGYLSAPYILDRGASTLMPYRHPDWEYLAEYGLLPAVRGGAFSLDDFPALHYPHDLISAAISQLTVALSNAYTFNSAGNCLAHRVNRPAADTLTAIYFYVTAVGGTGASEVNVEFRSDNGGIPGSTLHASGATGALSAVGWAGVTGLSFATSANTIYHAVVADANGGATNFVTALRAANTTGVFDNAAQSWNRASINSTAGFASANTFVSNSSIIPVFSSGSQGNPFTAGQTFTSSTNRRGWLIGGLTEALSIWGINWGSGLTSGNGVELYASATAPGGSTIASGSNALVLNTQSTIVGHRFSTAQTLDKATAYRLVSTFSSASTAARFFEIGTGANASIAAAMPGGGSWYLALANGTTDWANDNIYAIPGARILIADQIEVAVGGGGLARIIGG